MYRLHLLAVLLVCLVAPVVATEEREFDPHTIIEEPFPPLVDMPHIPARKVTDEVSDDELVLGVVVGKEARAYPINMLTRPTREIINDALGGRRLAATW